MSLSYVFKFLKLNVREFFTLIPILGLALLVACGSKDGGQPASNGQPSVRSPAPPQTTPSPTPNPTPVEKPARDPLLSYPDCDVEMVTLITKGALEDRDQQKLTLHLIVRDNGRFEFLLEKKDCRPTQFSMICTQNEEYTESTWTLVNAGYLLSEKPGQYLGYILLDAAQPQPTVYLSVLDDGLIQMGIPEVVHFKLPACKLVSATKSDI